MHACMHGEAYLPLSQGSIPFRSCVLALLYLAVL